MKRVVIIGGGVIGLCTAYFLRKEQYDVTVIDQSGMDFGASYVNAGYLSPSHIIPLAAPGVVRQGVKWMFNSSSPLYIKPRLEKDFMEWAWAFNRSCSKTNVERSIKAIKEIALLSSRLFSEIKHSEHFDFQLENKGLLMLCKTAKALEKEIELIELAKKEGLDAKVLSLSALKNMEPNVRMDVIGATFYQCDWHTTPHEFMDQMKRHLSSNGVQFYAHEGVKDLLIEGTKIKKIYTEKQSMEADEFVLAAGSWSNLLSKKLGIKIPLQAGKGYRMNVERPTGITIPAILAEAKVATTPMNGFTRFAGTMEIAGINHNIRPERVNAIANAVHRYYPDISILESEKEQAACGLRPVSPDGRPYIGRSVKCKNLTFATGHAMMGWSMATGTGKLVTEIISEKKTSIDALPFHPDRKF
jgi:D-amino-acid dehydrogenase